LSQLPQRVRRQQNNFVAINFFHHSNDEKIIFYWAKYGML